MFNQAGSRAASLDRCGLLGGLHAHGGALGRSSHAAGQMRIRRLAGGAEVNGAGALVCKQDWAGFMPTSRM